MVGRARLVKRQVAVAVRMGPHAPVWIVCEVNVQQVAGHNLAAVPGLSVGRSIVVEQQSQQCVALVIVPVTLARHFPHLAPLASWKAHVVSSCREVFEVAIIEFPVALHLIDVPVEPAKAFIKQRLELCESYKVPRGQRPQSLSRGGIGGVQVSAHGLQ